MITKKFGRNKQQYFVSIFWDPKITAPDYLRGEMLCLNFSFWHNRDEKKKYLKFFEVDNY